MACRWFLAGEDEVELSHIQVAIYREASAELEAESCSAATATYHEWYAGGVQNQLNYRYRGIRSCRTNPKIITQSSSGSDGNRCSSATRTGGKRAARAALSMAVKIIRCRVLLTMRDLSVYPAPVGDDHHNQSSTAAHVVASGAARMARGMLANVE